MLHYEARISTCELEVDVNVQDIVNRQDLNNSQCVYTLGHNIDILCTLCTFRYYLR